MLLRFQSLRLNIERLLNITTFLLGPQTLLHRYAFVRQSHGVRRLRRQDDLLLERRLVIRFIHHNVLGLDLLLHRLIKAYGFGELFQAHDILMCALQTAGRLC